MVFMAKIIPTPHPQKHKYQDHIQKISGSIPPGSKLSSSPILPQFLVPRIQISGWKRGILQIFGSGMTLILDMVRKDLPESVVFSPNIFKGTIHPWLKCFTWGLVVNQLYGLVSLPQGPCTITMQGIHAMGYDLLII